MAYLQMEDVLYCLATKLFMGKVVQPLKPTKCALKHYEMYIQNIYVGTYAMYT